MRHINRELFKKMSEQRKGRNWSYNLTVVYNRYDRRRLKKVKSYILNNHHKFIVKNECGEFIELFPKKFLDVILYRLEDVYCFCFECDGDKFLNIVIKQSIWETLLKHDWNDYMFKQNTDHSNWFDVVEKPLGEHCLDSI